MKLFTIGFTKKSAQQFFETLRKSGARRVIDIRLNNISQLAGFTKRTDLPYFLREICGMDYIHIPDLAPTQDLLDLIKAEGGDWSAHEPKFVKLLKLRKVESTLDRGLLDNACLLCSEDKPDHCHRRLVAEYLKTHWGKVDIIHL